MEFENRKSPMNYELEAITPAIAAEVNAMANDQQKMYIKNRRFFDDNTDLRRAVNRISGCFLMIAPRQDIRSSIKQDYYFLFDGKLYDVVVHGYSKMPIHLPEQPSAEDKERFQSELTEAFKLYRLYGFPDREPDFLPLVQVEVD
jgi:hypothetical protein